MNNISGILLLKIFSVFIQVQFSCNNFNFS